MLEQNFQWQGRTDGDGVEHHRIHQVINQNDHAQFALLGFASDEGVKRNKGRVGAVAAPDLIRKQLAGLPVHSPVHLIDKGNVHCDDGQLEAAQARLANAVAATLVEGTTPIVLGGGHEVAFGSFSGIFQYMQEHEAGKTIGIINFDAHFDLREANEATSGTPFLQAAQLSAAHNQPFSYLCLGVANHGNTKVLFDTADRLGCTYLRDSEVNMANIDSVLAVVDGFLAKVDYAYVTIDLDAFSAPIAPGVSAPAVKGIDLATFETIFQYIQKTNKIRLLDIAECNPTFDIDNRTAKLAAYIVYQFLFASH